MRFKGISRCLACGLLMIVCLVLGGGGLRLKRSPETASPVVPPYPAAAFLNGGKSEILEQAKFIRHADPQRNMRVVLIFRCRNNEILNQLIAGQGNVDSVYFGVKLLPCEFAQLFGRSPSEVNRMVAYLKRCGLTVTTVSSNHLLVAANGTVASIEGAFGVTINEYLYRGQVHICNAAAPNMRPDVGRIVAQVDGLNDFVEFRNKSAPVPHPLPVSAAPLVGMSPQQVATAYNFPNALNPALGPKYTGAGHSVAIVTCFGLDQNDVDTYLKQWGIHRTGRIIVIPVGGGNTTTHRETAMDVEQVAAQAAGADILVYVGSGIDSTNFDLVMNRIVTDNKADVVSMSFGASEESLAPSHSMSPQNTLMRQALVQGMTVFCSSGDRGAYDSGNSNLSVHFPASLPWVVAVGGTTLFLDAHGNRLREMAWIGSGGGTSHYFQAPAWQLGSGVPNTGMRNTADVALAANPFLSSYANFYKGQWFAGGGTSAATATWAALWVLADEACGQRLGSGNQTIYRIGRSVDYRKVFVDITSGNNGGTVGPGYSAGQGWDYPTGWGVPNGAELVEWLKRDTKSKLSPATPLKPVGVQ